MATNSLHLKKFSNCLCHPPHRHLAEPGKHVDGSTVVLAGRAGAESSDTDGMTSFAEGFGGQE